MIRYGIVDDYGDNWEDGEIVFSSTSLAVALDWREENNYHSASVVEYTTEDIVEKRTKVEESSFPDK